MQSGTGSVPTSDGDLESGNGARIGEEEVLIGDRGIVSEGASVRACGVFARSRIHIGKSENVVVRDGGESGKYKLVEVRRGCHQGTYEKVFAPLPSTNVFPRRTPLAVMNLNVRTVITERDPSKVLQEFPGPSAPAGQRMLVAFE